MISTGKCNNSSPNSILLRRNGNMSLCLARNVLRQELFISGCALGTRTLLWFGHECCRKRGQCRAQTLLWSGHGGSRKRGEHERYYGLGLDALENVGEAEARQLPELVQAKTPNNIDGKLTSQKYP